MPSIVERPIIPRKTREPVYQDESELTIASIFSDTTYLKRYVVCKFIAVRNLPCTVRNVNLWRIGEPIPSLQRRGFCAEGADGVVAHNASLQCERPPGAPSLEAPIGLALAS